MTRSACLNSIYELAKIDERVVFIGSDLAPNTMADFKRDFPDRWFMFGIQEQNVLGVAAGLALQGFIPYVNNIATFLTRRSYEQIVCDIALHNLPVRLLGNGGGLVYTPLGATHMAIDDIAIMRTIPNMSVICCSDNEEMKEFMPTTLEHKGPIYIRLGKDSDPTYNKNNLDEIMQKRNIYNIYIISTGIMSKIMEKTAIILNKDGIECLINHTAHIKPFDTQIIYSGDHLYKELSYNSFAIVNPLSQYRCLITAEEGIINGGLGSAVLECLADNNIQIPVLRFGLPDAFPCHYGEQQDLLETYGLTSEKMAKKIKEFYDKL